MQNNLKGVHSEVPPLFHNFCYSIFFSNGMRLNTKCVEAKHSGMHITHINKNFMIGSHSSGCINCATTMMIGA